VGVGEEAVLIVTAGSRHRRFELTICFCEEMCKEYGYQFKAYDLGGLGFGIPVNDLRLSSKHRVLRYSIKPKLILDTLNNTDEELVVWVDGDATLVGRIDEIDVDASFDVGVTVRPKRAIKKTSYINAGVLFFKNNAASKKLLQEWIMAMGPPPLDTTDPLIKVWYDDQTNLEEKILLPFIGDPLWDIIGTVHNVFGDIRVKLFDCTVYNNFMCVTENPQYDSSIKILHFRGTMAKPYVSTEYMKKWVTAKS
jgi:hypothetical protein